MKDTKTTLQSDKLKPVKWISNPWNKGINLVTMKKSGFRDGSLIKF